MKVEGLLFLGCGSRQARRALRHDRLRRRVLPRPLRPLGPSLSPYLTPASAPKAMQNSVTAVAGWLLSASPALLASVTVRGRGVLRCGDPGMAGQQH